MVTHKKDFRIYKPKNDGKGSASQFQLKITEDDTTKNKVINVFLVMSPQTGTDENGNSSFAWKDKDVSVTVKLGMADIGEFLAVLTGKKTQIGNDRGLYHQNQKGNTSVSFKKGDYKGIPFYTLRTCKQVDGKTYDAIQHGFTLGEGEILRILLEDAVRLTYQWG